MPISSIFFVKLILLFCHSLILMYHHSFIKQINLLFSNFKELVCVFLFPKDQRGSIFRFKVSHMKEFSICFEHQNHIYKDHFKERRSPNQVHHSFDTIGFKVICLLVVFGFRLLFKSL